MKYRAFTGGVCPWFGPVRETAAEAAQDCFRRAEKFGAGDPLVIKEDRGVCWFVNTGRPVLAHGNTFGDLVKWPASEQEVGLGTDEVLLVLSSRLTYLAEKHSIGPTSAKQMAAEPGERLGLAKDTAFHALCAACEMFDIAVSALEAGGISNADLRAVCEHAPAFATAREHIRGIQAQGGKS
jgi:hypothetical protein